MSDRGEDRHDSYLGLLLVPDDASMKTPEQMIRD